MAKPTMLQSLLGRPSQTYSFPEEKVYFSTKQDMVRIATETRGQVPLTVVNDDAILSRNDPITGSITDDILDDTHNHSDSDSERDVFYTPNTSPRTSMASSITAPLKAPSPRIPSTKTPSTQMQASTSTSSLSSTSLDAHSLFSLSTSDSTRMTTPVQSDSGYRVNHAKFHPQPPQNAHGYVDREWAKDVRWLVPSDSTKPNTRSTTTPAPRRRDTRPEATQMQHQTRTKPNTPMSKSISKITPSIMSSMTALLEEDEIQEFPQVHNPRSSVLISRPRPRYGAPRNRMTSSPSQTSIPTSPPTLTYTPPSTSLQKQQQPLHRRRSRSLGHTSVPSHLSHTSTSSSHPSASTLSPKTYTSKYASSSADPYDPSSNSLPTFTTGDLPSHGTRGYTSLVLPRAPVPFAQAPQRPRGFLGKDTGFFTGGGSGIGAEGKVDLTKSGVAQTTMASVEVVHGLSGGGGGGTGNPGKKIMGLFRRVSGSSGSSRSDSGPSSAFGAKDKDVNRSPGPRDEGTPASGNGHGVGTGGHVDLPLGFTSYRKPPSYVPGGSVLVQVWGVAVDGVDGRLVFGGGGEKSITTPKRSPTRSPDVSLPESPPVTPKRSVSLRSTLGRFSGGRQNSSPSSTSGGNSPRGASTPPSAGTSPNTPAAGVGYIPGRSFIGRVLECGWEVEEEMGKRGDWVVGLLDPKKCGALTEFIVVDRHRVHRVPHPRMDNDDIPLLTPTTAPSNEGKDTHDVGYANGGTRPNLSPGPSSSSSTPSPSRSSSMRETRHQKPHIPSLDLHSTKQHRPSPNSMHPLTLEELSLLPICGIPAYRAMRTFAFAFSSTRDASGAEGGLDFGSVDGSVPGSGMGSGSIRRGKGKGKEKDRRKDHQRDERRRRALVLRGHDGAGAMAVQMLVKRGWRVCVHVPYSCLQYEGEGMEDEGPGEGKEQYCMRMVEERIRKWGGEEVIFDDGEETDRDEGRGAAVRVIERLYEDGDVFDAVLDTVGGKEIWDISERLLKLTGKKAGEKTKTNEVKQFTTLVGDFPGRAIPSAGDNFKAGLRSLNFGVAVKGDGKKLEGGKVGYAWVSVAQDVDWEGEDIRESLGAVLRMALEDNVRPWVGSRQGRVMPFEGAPEVFIKGGRGVLADGGTVVVKVVG